ncbi:erythromycin esterase family protein [Deinococcus hopiensis]|nr:erythromycin esterase family protein [Deinococcus hopiensis]
MARNRSVVLIGESTHGTHEFYRTRAEITRRLLAEQGFDAVIIEGDWPDAQRVNRFVRGEGTDATPEEALANFERFPEWMWRNTVVRDFVGWLREHNRTQPRANQAGFYGMDLYSAVQSRQEVMRLLGALNPGGLGKVRDRYNCLNRLAPEVDSGMPMPLEGDGNACEQGVTAVLTELQQYRTAQRGRTGVSAEALFDLEQNARVVRNALTYERVSLDPFGGSSSWNVRDGHMFETLEAIRSHLGPQARVVVWAHNSHLGDASATEIGRGGELNLGQLVRQKYGMAALLVGFTTHTGTVTAARNWDRPGEKRAVRPSLVGSYERLFHDTGLSSFLLFPSRLPAAAWGDERLERAIGVVYAPETERESHYFLANLPRQFDAVIHFDVTRALEPLPQR